MKREFMQVVALMTAMGIPLAMATPLSAQTSATGQQQPACASVVAADNPDMALISDLTLTPHRFANIAEFIGRLPPEAMGRLGALQQAATARQATDWAYLCRYADENRQVRASGSAPRTIFIGDSITENWRLGDSELFGPSTLNRGIGGQTSPQILLRFYQDVVSLHPRVVHIMAGVNDILGNNGPASDEAILNNIRAMIDMAKANRIRVVLASITPATGYIARPGFDPSQRIAGLNAALARLASEQHVVFVDYHRRLVDGRGGIDDALANDGLHPNRDGYAVMRPLTIAAIERATRH